MAQRQNLQLERRAATERHDKRSEEGGEQVSKRQTNDQRQVPIYQPDRIIRDAQSNRTSILTDTFTAFAVLGGLQRVLVTGETLP